MVALFVVGEVKRRTPVDTGYLRGSIAYTIIQTGGKYILRIYTNVEYAIYVHEGTRRMQGRPFIRDGIEQNQRRIISLIKQAYARGLS
jgi:HK97 gp10 family phage protein